MKKRLLSQRKLSVAIKVLPFDFRADLLLIQIGYDDAKDSETLSLPATPLYHDKHIIKRQKCQPLFR